MRRRTETDRGRLAALLRSGTQPAAGRAPRVQEEEAWSLLIRHLLEDRVRQREMGPGQARVEVEVELEAEVEVEVEQVICSSGLVRPTQV